jgi:hypothetical protein
MMPVVVVFLFERKGVAAAESGWSLGEPTESSCRKEVVVVISIAKRCGKSATRSALSLGEMPHSRNKTDGRFAHFRRF